MPAERFAVIGLGSIGRRHLRLLRQLCPMAHIIAVRSGHGVSCEEEALADQVVVGLDAALALGVTAAIIASPASLHVPQARQLLQQGIHLLIEKPLSVDMQDLSELRAMATEGACVVQVGYVLRHKPSLQRFAELIQSGILGRVLYARVACGSYMPDWRPSSDYRMTVSANRRLGGGALLEISHEIDYALWLFGPIDQLQATLRHTGTLDMDAEDMADLLLISRSGASVSVHMDFLTPTPYRECLCVGENGQISWDAIQGRIAVKLRGSPPLEETYAEARDDMYLAQLNAFLGKIATRDCTNESLADAIAVMNVIEVARRASSSGRMETA